MDQLLRELKEELEYSKESLEWYQKQLKTKIHIRDKEKYKEAVKDLKMQVKFLKECIKLGENLLTNK